MRHEYDDEARCYVVRRNLKMSQRQWEVDIQPVNHYACFIEDELQ